jgi:cytochrome c biogenesis protein CcmG/thiol:disulfide interchange protein DsbE
MPDDRLADETNGRASRLLRVARLLAVGLVIALLGLLVWSFVRNNDGARFTGQISKGQKPPAPAFSLPVVWNHPETWPEALRPRLSDGRLTLQELRGYPLVVNFWASWCVPCKEEAPAFTASATSFRDRVVFVGVDVQDLKGAARGFLRRFKVNYVSVRDGGSGKAYTAYGLTGVPETYFVDKRGRVIVHSIGRVSRRDLTTNIRELLKESK